MTELLGKLIFENPEYGFFGSNSYGYYNMIIYNIYSIVFYLYFFYIFHFYTHKRKAQKIILFGAIVFIITAAINPLFQDIVASAQTGTYVVGGIILIGCTITYLNQGRTVKTGLKLGNNILFWISLGLLIFYAGYLPIKILRFYNEVSGLRETSLIRVLHLSLILLMYTFFIIGFIRMKKRLAK